MATDILIKRSTTPGAVPTTGDLSTGELAINTADKRLFTNNAGTIVEIGTAPSTQAIAGNATVGGTLGVTGNTTLSGTLSAGATTLASGSVSGNFSVTGTLTVATPSNSTDAASKGYVDAQVSALIDSAPGALDTLNELAAAINDDANFATTVTNALAGKLALTGGTMTGDITLGANKITSTATPATDDTLTRKGYVDSILGSATDAATSAAAAASSATDAANSASAASTSASNASTSATNAANSASSASTSATNASNSATAAASSATSASNSATASANSATAAATSATNAENAYDSFDDRYLGAKASDPTVDNDGDPLITGALYFDSTNGVMKVYNGSEWGNASSSIEGIKSDFVYTATASQTAFSGADDNSNTLVIDQAGLVNVFLNGVRLVETTDYTINVSTNTVTLVSGAAVNDIVEIEVFGNFAGQSGASVAITGGVIDGTTIGGSTPAAGTFTTLNASGDVNFDSNTLFVDASENRVGIGTSSPATNLDARGANVTTFDTISTIRIQGTNAYNSGNAGSGIAFTGLYDASDNATTFAVISGIKETTSNSDFDGALVFGTRDVGGDLNIERMRIDSSGNVGIGTTSPQEQIHVEGTIVAGTTTGYGTAMSGNIGLVSYSQSTAVEDIDALYLRKSGTNDSSVGIAFGNAGGADYYVGARIKHERSGANSNGDLVFETKGDSSVNTTAERMRIDSSGRLLVNTTTASPADNNTSGTEITSSLQVSRGTAAPVRINRTEDDTANREYIRFQRAGSTNLAGTITATKTTVSYNPFLGSHWASLSDWSRPDIPEGTIMQVIDELVDWRYVEIDVEVEADGETTTEIKRVAYNGDAEVGSQVVVEYEGQEYTGTLVAETASGELNKHVKVKVNDDASTNAVFGVFLSWNNDGDMDSGMWNDMTVAAVGNYFIRIASDQTVNIGDLIVADGNGCGVVQDDDIIRSKTVAKVTSTIKQKTYDDGSYLVTCVLMCG